RRSTQKLVDRSPGGLAEQIPQSDVDGRVTSPLHTRTARAEVRPQADTQRLDRSGVRTEQARGRAGMDIRRDLRRAKEGLAESSESRVGVDLDKQEVRKLVQGDGVDLSDAHSSDEYQSTSCCTSSTGE